MFRRRTPPRLDAVSAAQRRLAALAAQFDEAQTDRGVAGQSRIDPHAESADAWLDERSLEIAGAHASPPASDPPSPPGGRHAAQARSAVRRPVQLTPHLVTLAALAVAAVVAVAAWWVLRSAAHTESVQLSTDRVATGAAAAPTQPPPDAGVPSGVIPTDGTPATPSPTAAEPDVVVVDVAGKVRQPGIIQLPTGSRVADALDAAGGPKRGADTSSLNLARVLVDGEQVVVGLDIPVLDTPAAASGTTATTITPINLNTAAADQLETLPGIGPVTAAAILQWRGENGGFTSVDELIEVSGIGPATLADIEAYVYV